MSQLKTLVIVALSVLLCLSLNLGASDEEHSNGRGGLTGVQEFFTSGTFTVPKHVTHVMVTMWGSGGGGGAGNNGVTQCGFNGGFGGGGAYTNTVVAVIPGATYNITVGQGGSGVANIGENGGDGTDSQFGQGDTILVFAGGGKGGGAATQSSQGIQGSGGQADSSAQISHPAVSNAGYAYNLIPNPNASVPFGGPNISLGGGGGVVCGELVGSGSNGAPGYVLLTF